MSEGSATLIGVVAGVIGTGLLSVPLYRWWMRGQEHAYQVEWRK